MPKASITEEGEDLVFSCIVQGNGGTPPDPADIPPEGWTVMYRQGSEGFDRMNARIARGELVELPLRLELLRYQKKAVERAIKDENKRLGIGAGAPPSWGKLLAQAREEARREGRYLPWNVAFDELKIPDAEREAAKHACKSVEYRLRRAARTVPQNKPSNRLFPPSDDSGQSGKL